MRSLLLAAAAMAAFPLIAQEKSYWIANRNSNDIMEITPSGSVLRRIDIGFTLRDAEVNPIDGRIWVLRFINPDFYIVDPVSGTVSGPFTNALGSPFDLAFDAQGTAWLSGGTGVVNYDAAGTAIGQYPLTAASPLGITIDQQGNKWIAHRTTSGSVSRIDPTGAITNYPVTGGNPVRPIADYRGVLQPSHIWVTCDNGGSLLELDSTGAELNNYILPNASIGGIGPVFDLNGNIWVGSFGGAGLFQIDSTNGTVLNTFPVASPNAGTMSINGLAIDTLGRLLCSQRVTFSGVGLPCEVQRINPATGAIEVPIVLETGGFNAIGTQAGVSTPFQYALVVNQIGDLDGDGDANFAEILAGTSPIDATSNSIFTVDTTGTTSIGSTPSINVTTPSVWVLGFAGGLICPGVPVPGFVGDLLLDFTTLQGTVAGFGSAALPVALPNDPMLQGLELHIQGVIINAALLLEFRNVSGIVVW